MWLGSSPNKKQSTSKPLGVFLVILGLAFAGFGVGGYFFGTSAGQPHVTVGGRIARHWPIDPGSPLFFAAFAVALFILTAGVCTIIRSARED